MNIPLVGVSANEGSYYHGYNAGTGAISMGWPVLLNSALIATTLSNPATSTSSTAKTDAIYVLSASEGFSANSQAFQLGVAMGTYQSGEYVVSKVFGLVNRLILVVATRATTTDNWPAVTAASEAQPIVPTAKGFTASGATQSAPYGGILLLEAVSATASTTSNATVADSRIAQTVAVRAFVRLM